MCWAAPSAQATPAAAAAAAGIANNTSNDAEIDLNIHR